MFAHDELVKSHKKRADLIGNIVLISFAIILARLWYLQIYKGDILYRFSVENRLRKETVEAPRGMIFSRNNKLLVHNTPRFDAIIIPQYLKNKKQSIAKIAKILNLKIPVIQKEMKKSYRQAKYVPITIKKNISRKEVAIIETENTKIPGISVRTFISRQYLDNEVGGHLFGYISEISQKQLPNYRKRDNINYKIGDFIGQAGIEEEYDSYLRGVDGHVFMEVDARGAMKRLIRDDNVFKGIDNKANKPGNNLRITIDRDMQLQAYNSLEGKVGSVVALDINSGEILTMVSRPSYDPTQFSRSLSTEYLKSLNKDITKPFRDRTIQEHYPPGSTFKTITAIAALEEKIVDEETIVKCTGKFRLGKSTFHCWKKYGHGKVDIYKAIKESCDVYFYKIATKIDIDVLGKYARMFGLGYRTGISLPRETSGLIPSKEWKEKRTGKPWQRGETLSCAIGQSYVLVTTLQMAMAYAAIANGKDVYRPFLVKEIFSNSGNIIEKFSPHKIGDISISEKTLDIVKKGLFKVVNEEKGTAWWFRGLGIRMAGKTGTSQVVRMSSEKLFSKCEEFEYKFRNHGLFVAFAPADNPQIAVAAIIEHGCHGSTAAAPVVRNVITEYMKKYNPELWKERSEIDRKEYIRIRKEIQEAKKKASLKNNTNE